MRMILFKYIIILLAILFTIYAYNYENSTVTYTARHKTS